MEKTLVLIKPDAVERNLIGDIISMYENNGLTIHSIKLIRAPKDAAEAHYAEHKGKAFYNDLIEYITRSRLCAMIVEGENAIEKVREINGATDPKKASRGTVRQKYAISKTENSVHASDSAENALREIKIWF